MTIRYDEKGKFFTDVVTKDAVRANIQTLTHRIQGDVHVRIGQRIKDELDRVDRFIAVTRAEIYNLKGNKLYDTDFILVNSDHVIWLIPEEHDSVEAESDSLESESDTMPEGDAISEEGEPSL